MELIKNISEFFLLVVALGTGIYSFMVDSKMTGAGFIRLVTGLCLGSMVIAIIILFSRLPFGSLHILYSLSILCMILVYKFHKDIKSPAMWGLFFIQNLLLIGSGYLLVEKNLSHFIFFLSSAFYFGIINYAMILGHYYLVVPKLSEKPLVRSMEMTWILSFLKIVASVYFTYKASAFFSENTELGAGYMFNWLMLTMRYLWGYVAIVILSIFGWKLSKIRSTQSATGIMYVMVFFAIVGEIISIYLFYNYGLFV